MKLPATSDIYIGKFYWGKPLSEPHTSESDGTSDRLRTITIKHGKLVYSSIDNLNYTENSRNGLLTIYLTEMAH